MAKQNKTYWKYLTATVGALALFYVAPAAADGAKVYKSVCRACHGTGVIGAPKVGDKAAWAGRISQGMATLEEHAIKGFKGKKGMMPPKGGRKSLSDDDVKAAVAYMVNASK
jgi:cytochrome c5